LAGRLEGSRRRVEFCADSLIIRLEGDITSQARVIPSKPAPCRNPRQEYKTIDHAPLDVGLVWRPVRSGSVDSRESGQNPFSPSQRRVHQNRQRVTQFCSAKVLQMEKPFRSSRKCGRSGVLPTGAGGSRFSELETARRDCSPSGSSIQHNTMVGKLRSWIDTIGEKSGAEMGVEPRPAD